MGHFRAIIRRDLEVRRIGLGPERKEVLSKPPPAVGNMYLGVLGIPERYMASFKASTSDFGLLSAVGNVDSLRHLIIVKKPIRLLAFGARVSFPNL